MMVKDMINEGNQFPRTQRQPVGPSSMQERPSESGNPQAPGKKAPKKKSRKPTRPTWVTVILTIFKILFIPLLLFTAVIVGLWVGYVKLGKQPSEEIFRLETWKHLYDLVFAEK